MTPEIIKSDETAEAKEKMLIVESKVEDNLTLSKISSTESAKKEQWRQFGEETSVFITNMQNSVAQFFKQYQPLLGSVGWILLALLTVKITVALLDAINDIPFLSLILELIGLGYLMWFTYRYLLSATSRQELSGQIQSFKKQFFDPAN